MARHLDGAEHCRPDDDVISSPEASNVTWDSNDVSGL